jgi:hypothetical protein
VSIDVVTRKKMSRMKEISAVELEFSPGTFFFFLAIIGSKFNVQSLMWDV